MARLEREGDGRPASPVRRPSRARREAAVRLLAALAVLLPLAACGKKGPPLAPLRIVPARIENLSVVKTGEVVRASFAVPAANDDGSQPADIVAVELYGLSGKPEDPFGQTLNAADFLKYAELAGRVEIEPPPDPDAPEPPPGAPRPPDPRPAQGESATITEMLDARDRVPFVHPKKKSPDPVPQTQPTVLVRPLTAAPVEELFSRTYVVVGLNRKGQKGAASNRVALPLLDSPAVPVAPEIDYSATAVSVSWTVPGEARRSVQRPAEPGELPARSLAAGAAPTTYNVYRVRRTGDVETVEPAPVNPAPVEQPAVADQSMALGTEQCYHVRAVRTFGNARIESEPSPVVCKLLVDTFAPAAPKNLSAVGSEGGVSLIWDPGTESDLAGYLVLRGEIGADGAAPQALGPLMAEPIRQTTYRDTTARPGARYVYAVVAVDGATPRNQSAESNRVEEGAR